MADTTYFDDLETRSADARAVQQYCAACQRTGCARAQQGLRTVAFLTDGQSQVRCDDPAHSTHCRCCANLNSPNGRPRGLRLAAYRVPPNGFAHVFQSPGPIYEPGGISHDWWRMGRFLHAVGFGGR